MTIRKMWLIVLSLISILSVGINTVILTTLTDKYFADYLKESYDVHIEHILDYTKTALSDKDITSKQMSVELESHLNDPIIQIKVYSADGDLLVNVDDDYHITGNKMSGHMGGGKMGNMMRDSSNEVAQYEVVDDGKVIGILNVTLHSVAENSFVARQFKSSLFINSTYAILISTAISIFIGFFISKKMSSSLRDTAKIAADIQLGEITPIKSTSIKEIYAIREGLEELDSRLRLKQKSRQVLVDQLVHQTRTPLTILKSHLEAIEDGLIEINEEEIKMFQNQIENITTIIANMSGMIDASKETDVINVEGFEINQMLKQIIIGLKAQFTKKNITLELVSNDKLMVYTDKNKLSQSIYNILTNAYKYTNENDNVRVSFIHLDNKVMIKIQDTGIGIATSEIDKIFNAYYRGSKAIHIEGDGIGLYIVKDNIEKIGGNISVTSKLKVGSAFTIEIPVSYDKE
ncbi:MAG TPA: HAMP domain-containing histidine kinase [Epulopiscium sp.]|nr:HAMP domain-containing histidine kinase [Candidatus Epulonipiscium sp.]